jgi:hypothetical protein
VNGIGGIIFVVCLPPWRFYGWPHDMNSRSRISKRTQVKQERTTFDIGNRNQELVPKSELLSFYFLSFLPIRFNDYNMFNSLKGFKVPQIFRISLRENAVQLRTLSCCVLFLLDDFLLLFYSMILIIVCHAIVPETTTVCLLVEGHNKTKTSLG